MTKPTAIPTRSTPPLPMRMRSPKPATAAKPTSRKNTKPAPRIAQLAGAESPKAKPASRHIAPRAQALSGNPTGDASTLIDQRNEPASRHIAPRAQGLAGSPDKPASNASRLIDQRIEDLADWRGDLLAQLRAIVKEVALEIVEEWKWRGVPVWSCNGIVCTGETYKTVVKMTFAKGAALSDPAGLFNSSLEGNTRRAIDFAQGAKINVKALKALLRDAVALNRATTKS